MVFEGRVDSDALSQGSLKRDMKASDGNDIKKRTSEEAEERQKRLVVHSLLTLRKEIEIFSATHQRRGGNKTA